MGHVEQIYCWDQTTEGARAALALSRVLAPLNAELSEELRDLSQNLAVALGQDADGPEEVPALLADEPLLVECFKGGAAQMACMRDDVDANPSRVWCSDWSTSMDGTYEVRASVAQSAEGFMAGLEVSRLGGDCLPGYGDPVASLEEAIELAKAQRSQWHELDGDNE